MLHETALIEEKINWCIASTFHDKLVPVTMAWHVLSLQMEERPPIWRVAANILNKQSQTANKEWSSSLRVGRGVNNSSPQKCILLQNIQTESLRPGLILCRIGTGGRHLLHT
jgi:hypothetical protein